MAENKLEFRSRKELIWMQFKKHKIAMISLGVLAVFLIFIVFGDFIIPYSPTEQHGNFTYVPPRDVHFIDADGDFHLRPFIYEYKNELDPETWETTWIENTDKKLPIYFFQEGFEYKLFGLFTTDIHLFGTEEGALPVMLFGSDQMGRDLFSQTIYATRISISIAIFGTLISFILSVILGGISGYFGGIIDEIIQRFSELLMSIPRIPLWMALAAAVPNNWSVIKLYMALVFIGSLIGWPGLARAIRSRLLSMREEDFVYAAKSYGASSTRIILKYLVPNFVSYLIVSLTLGIPALILYETSLSFLGLGLRAPAISWGVLLEQAQSFQNVIIHPWLLIPGIFVVIAILAFNFVGDGLRDASDPYERA
jgi:peptide/nickel transport system permease protein